MFLTLTTIKDKKIIIPKDKILLIEEDSYTNYSKNYIERFPYIKKVKTKIVIKKDSIQSNYDYDQMVTLKNVVNNTTYQLTNTINDIEKKLK